MPRFFFKLVLLLSVLGAPASMAEMPSAMVFQHLSTEDGLPQNSVMAILQDSQGFIWLATEDGLARFDGYDIVRYGRDRSGSGGLASSFIWAIQEDRDGDLWLATQDGGVARWHRQTDQFTNYQHDPGNPATLSSNSARQLLIDHDGRIWVGTRGGGLNVIEPESGRIKSFRHDPQRDDTLSSDVVTALHVDPEGQLWVGTDGGLNRFLPESGSFRRYLSNAGSQGALSGNRISALQSEPDGTLWVGTFDAGLNRLDPGQDRFLTYRHAPNRPDTLANDEIRAILLDTAGRLWLGTASGLNLFDRATRRFFRYQRDAAEPSSLADNYVMSLYQDHAGLLWVGTRAAGVSRWNPRSWTLGHYRPKWLRDAYVMSFADDSLGRLWIGTFGGGLHRFDPASGAHASLHEIVGGSSTLSDNRVMSLLTDRSDNLWIGTMSGGLGRLTPAGQLTSYKAVPDKADALSANGIMSILQSRTGHLWLGTFGGGVNVLDPSTGRVQRLSHDPDDPNSLSSQRATSLAEDKGGFIWVGTEGDGLNLVSPAGRVIRRFHHDPHAKEGLSAETIFSLHADSQGRIWIGTDGGGLDQVVGSSANPESIHFRNVSKADGLSSDVIYGIRSDASGDLWLSSNAGLTRYDPESGNSRIYHRENGLQGEEFNFGSHFRMRSGQLCFGGATGFNLFDPSQLLSESPPPAVALTRVDVMNAPATTNTPYPRLRELTLGYQDKIVSFEFAALDFTAPRRNTYSYRLHGFDADWVDLGYVRRVSYTNLDAGEYQLEVRAANSGGIWSDVALSLPVTVKPALWLTTWAKLAYGAAAIFLALGVWQVQRRKLRLAHTARNQLEHVVSLRTSELSERNIELKRLSRAKDDFLARMSHEIRTPLNGVIGMAELLTESGLSSRQAQLAGSVHTSARSLLEILNEILDLARVESGRLELEHAPFDLRDVVEEASVTFAAQAEAKGLVLTISLPAEGPWHFVGDAARLRQVMQNLIGNAIKFTSSGEINVSADFASVAEHGADIVIAVQDTGLGMVADVLERIFEPFSQADESTTRRFGGTGLGLAICRQLLAMMGGTLVAASEPEIGSTFTVRLPLQFATGQQAPEPAGLVGLRVRLVCRRDSLTQALLRLARAWRLDVDVVDTATSAPRISSEAGSPPIVWIVDADGSGNELERLEFQRQCDSSTTIVAVASHSSVSLLGLEQRFGTGAVVIKPVRHRELYRAIAIAANRPIETTVSDATTRVPVSGTLSGHVLVVEDNPVNAAVAEGMLLKLGCTATLIDSGRKAVACVRAERFDLVLMDLHMPDLDGLDTTALIRKVGASGDQIPIVALTADTGTANRERCLAAGMNGFLGKPFTLAELHQALSPWLPVRRPDESAEVDRAADVAASSRFDRGALARIRALDQPGRPSLVPRVITMFTTGSTAQLVELRSAMDRADLEAIRALAHSLKSASSNVGANEVAQLAYAVERACEHDDADNAHQLAGALIEAHSAAILALEHELMKESA